MHKSKQWKKSLAAVMSAVMIAGAAVQPPITVNAAQTADSDYNGVNENDITGG